ncbi:MAG: class I adenylate-forming enzyme family protein [Gammaproteobacteria bacterium]
MHTTDLFFRGYRNHPERLALSGDGGDFTYRQAYGMANRIARRLRDAGFGPGDRFAVLSPNSSRAFLSMLGGMRAGVAWCNLNMKAALPDILHILAAGKCNLLFFDQSAAPMLAEIRKAVPTLREAVCIGGMDPSAPTLEAWLEGVDDAPLDFRIPEDTQGFQGATGGTTGRSKLTVGSNRFMLTSVMAWSTCLHFDEPPVNLAVAPITHAGGFVALGMGQFSGTTIMMSAPDVGHMIELIEQRRVNVLFLPPTLIYMLLAHPKAATADFSSLRYLIAAASPFAPEKIVEAVNRLGPVVCQAYGQTESGFPTTFMSPHEMAQAVNDPEKRHLLLSCGRPTVTVEAMEVMDEEGRILGPGETGEVVLRGPTLMKCYLDDEAATAEIQKYGWHHTGDIGKRDEDGYFYITDRKRDLIISGGFNIFPFEVESAMMKHPAVQDCAVIGVPDEKWGEAVKACVQLKPGMKAEAGELIEHAKALIGSMKAPKSVDFVENLPRSPVGKVLKRELRVPYWEGKGRGVG